MARGWVGKCQDFFILMSQFKWYLNIIMMVTLRRVITLKESSGYVQPSAHIRHIINFWNISVDVAHKPKGRNPKPKLETQT